ncbi:hypothetical protein [Nannocystis pusilla]
MDAVAVVGARAAGALRWPIAVFRGLQPLRWLHAYGVFRRARRRRSR